MTAQTLLLLPFILSLFPETGKIPACLGIQDKFMLGSLQILYWVKCCLLQALAVPSRICELKFESRIWPTKIKRLRCLLTLLHSEVNQSEIPLKNNEPKMQTIKLATGRL